MYDSRSDMSVKKGTHTSGRSDSCGDCDGAGCIWCGRKSRTGAKQAIAEGLSEYLMLDEPIEHEPVECETFDTYSSESDQFSAKATKEAKMYDTNRNIAVAERSPGVYHKPRVTKHQPRVKGEPFDPSKVSTTLNGRIAANIQATQPAKHNN